MADTYHAIKLYKTTANSTTSSKRVGINVTDSTDTTGYALYVNGAINITDSLKTNSLNSGDLVVTGSASFTNGVTVGGELKFNKISAPTASGGTTYGNGTNGQVLKSNGTTVYWASDSNTNTLVRTYASTNDIEIPFIGGSTSTTPAAPTHTSGYANLYGAIPGTIANRATINLSTGVVSVKGLKIFGLTTAANAIAIYSDANGTFSTKATASGAAYATAANGALTFGTLPVAQGGTGVTSIANIKAGKDGDGNTISSTYLKLSGGTLTGDLTFSGEAPFIYFDDNSKHYGAIYTYDGVVIRNYATNNVNFEDYALPTPGAITANGDYEILTSKMYGTNTENFLRNDGSWARPGLKITLLHSDSLPTGDNYKNLGIHSLYVFITNPSSSFTATMVPFDWIYSYTGSSNAKSILLSDEVNFATAYIFWNGSSIYIQRNAGQDKTWYIYGID